MAEPFDCFIIHIYMCNCKWTSRKRCGINGVAVILCGNLYPSCLQILDRLVPATMSELHLIGLCPNGKCKELMSKTNPKNWLLSYKLLNLCNNLRYILGVARPI